MSHQVFLTAEAEEDVFDIYRYVLADDGRDRADHVLAKLQETCQSLKQMPGKGHIPPELDRIGVHGFLEIHFKPYRIMYQIVDKKVFIHGVLDGRRALQDVLERRLLR
jgi:toxin ParE1/3/4